MSQSLPEKYRPTRLADVVGHVLPLKAIQKLLVTKSKRVIMFHGPAGTGKTTLARILATEYGCSPEYIMEVDGATNNGVEHYREIQDILRYKPMGKNAMRAVIIDEAHMLTKSAWNSLLKSLEEPAAHVVWFICTTEPDKILPTIKSRTAQINLPPLSVVFLKKILSNVIQAEKMKVKSEVIELIAKEARGSPRQALSYLEVCAVAENEKEAAALMESAGSSDMTIALCRLLVTGGGWGDAMKIVSEMKTESPEGVRIVVCNYVASVLKKAKGKEAARLLHILESFEGTFNQSEKQAPLLLAIGRVLFQ